MSIAALFSKTQYEAENASPATPEPEAKYMSASISVGGVDRSASTVLSEALRPAPSPTAPLLSVETTAALAVLLDYFLSSAPIPADVAADVHAALTAGKDEIETKLGIKIT
jgi:hypothetical protein